MKTFHPYRKRTASTAPPMAVAATVASAKSPAARKNSRHVVRNSSGTGSPGCCCSKSFSGQSLGGRIIRRLTALVQMKNQPMAYRNRAIGVAARRASQTVLAGPSIYETVAPRVVRVKRFRHGADRPTVALCALFPQPAPFRSEERFYREQFGQGFIVRPGAFTP